MARAPRPARLLPAPGLTDPGPMSGQMQGIFAESAVISGAPATDAGVQSALGGNPTLLVNALTNAVRR